jgi:probable HAF family extracellular repeat protein
MKTSAVARARGSARRLFLWTVLPMFMATAPQAYAQSYRLSFLPGEGGLYNTGTGINNAGQVVGTVGYRHQPMAVLWTGNGYPTYLLETGECCRYVATGAAAINNAGQIVGTETYRAALWTGPNSRPTLLAAPEGATSQALSINDAGQVVGTIHERATLWSGNTVTDLGTLGGITSSAYDINNHGLVVGTSQRAGDNLSVATAWWRGAAYALATTGSFGSEARAVNDAGSVVGYSDDRATLWTGSTASFLGDYGSRANDINASGWVVGSAAFDDDIRNTHAALWRGGRTTDLNSFLSQSQRQDGWVLEYATAINDSGWITGTALNMLTYERSAYLLSAVPAVPEASTWVLMVVGMALLGLAAQRQRTRVG